MTTTTKLRLDDKIKALLQDRGYTIVRQVGEGNTRDVFEVEYKSGSLIKRRIAKIPKSEIDKSSVTTLINLSKGDLDEREVIALNKARHQNVIEIYDAFKLNDRTVTIEEYYDAISLEDLVKMTGPIKDPAIFRKIFSQIIDGLRYLHLDERLLHRDIKPSNILVGKGDNFVKISDLQNAGKLDEITETMLPTRGGTAYTHPEILNALMTGQETRCSLASEFYALGATMYYSLTGKQLFDRKLLSDRLGKIITINGEGINVLLTEDGTPVEKIDVEQHEKILKKRLKEIPKRYRQLLYNCLSLENGKYKNETPWKAYNLLDADFEKATRNGFVNWNKVRHHAWMGTFSAALLAGIIGGVGLLYYQGKNVKEPSLIDTLRSDIYPEITLEKLVISSGNLDYLVPYFKDIRENLHKVEAQHPQLFGRWSDIRISAETHHMSKRLSYSLIRSVLMEDPKRLNDEYHDQRAELSLVPYTFCREIDHSLGFVKEKFSLTDHQKVGHGIWYLKRCISNERSLDNVFARYFSSEDELLDAMQRAMSREYLPSQKMINDKPILTEGYSLCLSPVKRDLINRALALYHITDAEGKIHLEALDDNSRPINGLDAK